MFSWGPYLSMYLDGVFLHIMLSTAIVSIQNWSSQQALLGHMIRIGLHAPILPIILFSRDSRSRTANEGHAARRATAANIIARSQRTRPDLCLPCGRWTDGRTAMAMAAMRHMSPIALGGRAGGKNGPRDETDGSRRGRQQNLTTRRLLVSGEE